MRRGTTGKGSEYFITVSNGGFQALATEPDSEIAKELPVCSLLEPTIASFGNSRSGDWMSYQSNLECVSGE